MGRLQITVVSDIHYASAAEQERRNHETRWIKSRLGKAALAAYRDHIWLREPLLKNYLLDRFLERAGSPELVVANGDFSCDTAFIGHTDPASRQSAEECLGKLRQAFPDRLLTTMGDHELGKVSMAGRQGGLRFDSYTVSESVLGIPGFWERDFGAYKFIGIASSVIAFPVLEAEALREERPLWQAQRERLLELFRESLIRLKPGQRVLLFCHDPTALPFLVEDPVIGRFTGRIEATIIGHLHSPLVFWKARMLAGLPPVPWFGTTVLRMTKALRRARLWKPLKPRLCPALAGVELLKDGGWLTIDLDLTANEALKITRHRLPR